ncbi:hypothetical protein ASPCADRAFT_508108 [Aspergillus carbonarius ITEM 5010]|uniref:Uncharacterized protein n=1 Tax=Aspergillus carbonarius (strain ITEM 5010) TaxID=602072 RepID=A0A1R3RIQ9_ASPC5|nr:hypothetical protein ASPCADRAFT_508108 [Aspergillus carbonarius ITEM 5010]
MQDPTDAMHRQKKTSKNHKYRLRLRLQARTHAMVLVTLPFAEHTPARNPVRQHKTAPRAALADLDHRLPHAAIPGRIGERVATRVGAEHVFGLSRQTQDLARWRLDRQLRRLLASGHRPAGRDGRGRRRKLIRDTRNRRSARGTGDHTQRTGRSGEDGRGDTSADAGFVTAGREGERGRVLADGKNEGVVDSQLGALWLHDVEVVPLSVGRRMAQHEIIRRVVVAVENGQGQSQRMGDVAAGMHQAPFAGVHLDRALPLIAR